MNINKNMVSTLLELPGYTVTHSLGVSRGISARSVNMFSNAWGLFRSRFGGRIKIFTAMCEKAREEAFNILIEHAEGMGANAVLGVRYDANEVYAGITEIIAYGTAVIVEKKV